MQWEHVSYFDKHGTVPPPEKATLGERRRTVGYESCVWLVLCGAIAEFVHVRELVSYEVIISSSTLDYVRRDTLHANGFLFSCLLFLSFPFFTSKANCFRKY